MMGSGKAAQWAPSLAGEWVPRKGPDVNKKESMWNKCLQMCDKYARRCGHRHTPCTIKDFGKWFLNDVPLSAV